MKYRFSYSELVEVHRTDEATATPDEEGAHLSDYSARINAAEAYLSGGSNNKRS